MGNAITKRTLNNRIDYLNSLLKGLHSEERLLLDNAYRKCCLVKTDEDGTVRKTLMSNMTKRELYDHLSMMEEILWMLPDPRLQYGREPY